MKAVRFHEPGGVDKLQYEENVPEPQIGPTEVLVRVRGCALNHLDIWVRMGQRGQAEMEMPHILGCDVAGEVAAVGSAVQGIQKGQKVVINPGISCGRCAACLSGNDNMCLGYNILGQRANGGYAEYVKAPATNIVPMPARLSFEEAASVPLVFLTAWHMLVARARLQAGEDVLVQAAGSGVGIAAIQIAKLFGARVITTASTDEKLKKAKALGADEAINYTSQDFAQEVRRITNKKGVDVVIEHVGGDVFEKSVRCLATNGRLVTCGATAGFSPAVDLRYVYSRHQNILGSYMGSKSEVLHLLKFFDAGQLKPVVHAVFPLKDAGKAHEAMENRQNFGKLVLQVP
ncbi:MAG: zinc-binding dehydrogenase [Chloroflexi bacterium]|nr:zinc-binding dehydrogenase [Chloroflexota bacterium]